MLSLVVPVYNEEDVIETAAGNILKEFENSKIKLELILVNNGSTDNTGKIMENLKQKNIKKVTLKANQTFGGGVIGGLKIAKGGYFGITCAGGKVPVSEIVRLYRIARENNIDFCKGDRGLKYSSKTRVILSVIYGMLVRLFFSLKISDINGYPIIIKRSVYEKIKPKLKNWNINVEMLHKASKFGCKILSIPVKHGDRLAGASHVGMGVVWDMFVGLIRYRLAAK
ncbi:glycosyltransferase family 2 protein [Candidatus Woesearchaeota archaeon]|nr:glycosyltransferase family 2 protein [Candidatus Woesearchaeota archaeon]